MAFNQLLVATLPLACSMLGSLLALPSSNPFDSYSFAQAGWLSDYPYDSLKHGTDPIPSIVKKLPVEDKSFKKSAMPLPSAAHCLEISAKDSRTKCYRCKDPSSSATYEHCSYSSDRAKARGSRSSGGAALASSALVDSAIGASTQPRPSTYRFGADYFQAEPEEQAELEPSASDNCRRERRDSMLCMVCKDPKTNGKYEQCSYVGGQPRKQPPKPSARGQRGGKQRRERLRDEPEDESGRSEEAEDGRGPRKSYLGYPSYLGGRAADDEEAEDEAESAPARSQKLKSAEKGCKSVERDGESCTVCTDPKTGAKSEKCNYSFEPKDKAYAYSKSKSFGYPEGGGPGGPGAAATSYGHAEDDGDDADEGGAAAGYSAEAQSRQESAEDYGAGYASPDYIRSESERISKKVASEGDCREEKRDGMVCRVCKEPRTGDDFEQCNYSYEPDDKVYAYSKSKHFGSASPDGGGDGGGEYGGESAGESEERAQPEEASYSSSVLDYLPRPSESKLSDVYSSYASPSASSKERDHGGAGSRVDSGFHDAAKRRAEIERIVQQMGAQDRSKCSKTYRGGMTCYSCKDDKGFSDEECVFVTEPEQRSSSLQVVTDRPTAEASSTTSSAGSSPSATTTAGSAGRRRRRSHEAGKREDAHEQVPLLDQELDEAEPYDYVAETRPLYDKVLGLTLPAYMVNRSKQEIDFDRSVDDTKP